MPAQSTAYVIKLSRHLAQPAADAFAAVEDIERFPEFMPNVNAIRVIESSDTRKVAEWDTTIDDAPVSWVEEGVYDRDNFLVRFRALEGVFDRFDGYWQVTPEAEGSTVTFELIYVIGLPEIEDLVGPILRERLVQNAERMLEAIDMRVAQR